MRAKKRTFAYKLAAAGNRTNLVENLNGSWRTNVWGYDPLYRLTNEVISGAAPAGAVSYKYDAVGNRTNRTSSVSGVTNQTWAYNGNDQLTTDAYDSNGNTRTNGSNTYQYNVENRLTNYNSGTAIYVYDGDGNRVRKTVGGVTTYYLVDDRNPTGYAQVLEERTSTTTNLFAYGLDLISQRQSDGTTHCYGYDGNGNVRFLTAANATVSDTYVYDAFGIVIANTGSTPNNYRYTGEQYDSNLGFYYLRARFMNPNTGRFMSRDTFEGRQSDPLSLHRYLYAQNDPVNNTDPSGNEIEYSLAVISFSGTLAQISNPVTSGAQRTAQRRIQQATASTGRPSSATFWKNYPDYSVSQQDVWRVFIGGNLGRWGDTPDPAHGLPNGQNSCAARVSHGLNYSGAPIPNSAQGPYRAWKNKKSEVYLSYPGDDKNYIVGAGRMNAYLKNTWGNPDKTLYSASNVKAYISGLKDEQCAIFATSADGPGHTGVLKRGYTDPYVEGYVPVDIWLLPL